MKNALTFILYILSLQIHVAKEAELIGLDPLLPNRRVLTKDDMEFIISAQRTYCLTAQDCQSDITPITDVNMTVLETRLKYQIDIQPAYCCEQCTCDDVCCCSSEYEPDTEMDTYLDENQQLCVHTQFKTWHLGLYSYPNSLKKYWISTACFTDMSDSLLFNQTIESQLFSPPVFDSKNNITYINTLCARYHNRSIDHLVPWNAIFECTDGLFHVSSSENLMETLINNTNCNLIYYPPENVKISECTRLIDRCNVTGRWSRYDFVIERACMLYTAPYATSFKNMFCYLCNLDIEIPFEMEKCNGIPDHPNLGKFTLQILLRTDIDFSAADYDDKGLSEDGHEHPIQCTGQTLYDSLQRTCVTATCISPYVFLKGECVNIAKRIGGILYRMFLVLIPKFEIVNVNSEAGDIETYILNMLDKIKLYESLTILSIHESKQTSYDPFLVVHIDLLIGNNYKTMVETENIEQLTRIKTIDIDANDRTTGVSKSYFVYYDKYEISYNGLFFTDITLQEDNENEATSLKRIKERSLDFTYPDVYIMVLYPLSFCPLMALNTSFYNITILSRHVFIGLFKVKLNQSEYVVQDDSLNIREKSVFVCKDTYTRLTEKDYSNEGATFHQNPIVVVSAVATFFTFLL